MPGGVAYGYHEGSRSQELAHPVFLAFGTAVPVPYSEDFGLDFYCTLMERKRQLFMPQGYYAVQVKSRLDPWIFKSQKEIQWFVQCPMSIFLSVVSKSKARIRIYHTSPRFYVWALPPLPERLQLVPGTGTQGTCTEWSGGTSFSLSAPILDFELTRPETDREFRATAAGILKFWIDVDEANLRRVKLNLREFQMPDQYQTNVLPRGGKVFQGLGVVDREDLEQAVGHLKEPLDKVSDQLLKHGDVLTSIRGMLLSRQLCWDDYHRPQSLTIHANTLNHLLARAPASYLFEGIDDLGSLLDVRLLECLENSKLSGLLDHVQRVYLTGRHVTDRLLAPLKDARELQSLHLCNTRITDEGLQCIKGLTELRELHLADTKVTDSGLKHLRTLRKLKILTLARTRISGVGLKHLKKLRQLEYVNLDETKANDEGLKHAARLPGLDLLTVNGTRVTDKGLMHLRKAPRFRRLDIKDTKTTQEGIAELQKAVPGLCVVR